MIELYVICVFLFGIWLGRSYWCLMSRIVKASESKVLVRGFFVGASRSGKSYSALLAAQALGGRCCVIDTEQHSIRRYSRSFAPWDFDILPLTDYGVDDYLKAIDECIDERYDVIVIDTATKLWGSKGGLCETAEEHAQAKPGTIQLGWNKAKNQAKRVIEEYAKAPCHLIYTFRSAGEYEKEGGKFKMVGERIDFAKGIEYESNVLVWMNKEHSANIDVRGSEPIDILKPSLEDFKKIFADFETGENTNQVVFNDLLTKLKSANASNLQAVRAELTANKKWLSQEQIDELGAIIAPMLKAKS